jgi:hypothetical protein
MRVKSVIGKSPVRIFHFGSPAFALVVLNIPLFQNAAYATSGLLGSTTMSEAPILEIGGRPFFSRSHVSPPSVLL